MASPYTDKVSHWIITHRWLWLLLTVLLTIGSVMGAKNLYLDPDARIFFDPKNPDRIALDEFEATFAKDDNLMIVIVPKGGDTFTPETLAAIGDITEQAWLLPFVRRVDSLTNFQHTYADGDELIVRDLIPEPTKVTITEAVAAKKIALNEIVIQNSIVSDTGHVSQVQVMFRLPGENPQIEVPTIMAETFILRDAMLKKYPHIEIKLTGSTVMNNQFSVSGQEDSSTLTPAMLIAILLIVGIVLLSISSVFMAFIIMVLSAIMALGALGWSGVPINSATIMAPLIVMTLSVAAVVHILSAVRQIMPDTADRKEWARRALADHMVAIIIAGITTAIGFFSLNFSISPPFRQLGNIVGVGVLAALFLTLTLLPTMITVLSRKRWTKPAKASQLMVIFGEWVIRCRKWLLWGSLAVVVIFSAGISKLVLEDNWVQYFDTRYEFRQDTDFTEANLTGLNVLEWSLSAGEEQGINNPEYLRKVEAFSAWLLADPNINHVRTLTDTIKRLNKNMHGDDQTYYRLPDTRAEASQYIFLYELSLGYGMDLTDQIDIGRSRLRISANMPNVSTIQMRDLTQRATLWLQKNAPEMLTQPTGMSHVFNLISYRDVRAMLSGSALALVAISIIILLVLRNFKIGMLSLVPNLVPAAMAFGIWGYTVGGVTLAISVVIAMTLGIVVDDTVHFLSKYAEARRKGKSAEDSVRHAFKSVGMALLLTTVALVVGFCIMAQSGFAVNGDLAKLTAITISIALVADFLLLPPLLIALDKGKK